MLHRLLIIVLSCSVIALGAHAQQVPPMPARDSRALLTCDGLAGDGLALCGLLDTLNPSVNWAPGVHVNALSGGQDRPAGSVAASTDGHGPSFAATVAYQLGTYLLRPPGHRPGQLANDQFTWMWNQAAANQANLPDRRAGTSVPPRAGWTVLGSSTSAEAMADAQGLANLGYLVVAAFRNEFAVRSCLTDFYSRMLGQLRPNYHSLPYVLSADEAATLCPGGSGPGVGHVAVVRPNAAYAATGHTAVFGPDLAQAGRLNARGVTALEGFGTDTFSPGMVYFFVFGGAPPAYQASYAGLFGDGQAADGLYGVQRSPQGYLQTGLFTYDASGAPVWYYGESWLDAANWRETPRPRAGVIPVSGYESPSLWKPYFQPATRGTNLWDPEGDPMPWQRVGQFSLGFGAYDSSSVSASLLLDDPGQVAGPSGTVLTNPPRRIATGPERAFARVAAGSGPAQIPAANAPAAGWWWASYGTDAWNQGTTGFKPLGLFIDAQGTTVSAVVAGAASTPVPQGSSAAPYRPYWWLFSGTVQPSGQVVGSLSTCSLSGNNTACIANASGVTLGANADGTMTLAYGGTQVRFARYRTGPALPPSQSIPIYAEAYNPSPTRPWGYMAQISVGGGAPQIVTFDLGSSGLYIEASAVGPNVTRTGIALPQQQYDSGVVYESELAYGTFSIGGVTSAQPVPFALITKMSCANGQPNCPVATGSQVGRVGTMGVIQKGQVVSSPLYQLPQPYGAGYILSLKNLSLTVGITPAARSTFNQVQMAAVAQSPSCAPGPNGCAPAWNNATVTGCFSLPDLPSLPRQCITTLFDSGAGNIRMTVDPSLQSVAQAVTKPDGKMLSGTRIQVDMPPFFTGQVFKAGDLQWINQGEIVYWNNSGNYKNNYANSNLGAPALLHLDALWDGATGKLGIRQAP